MSRAGSSRNMSPPVCPGSPVVEQPLLIFLARMAVEVGRIGIGVRVIVTVGVCVGVSVTVGVGVCVGVSVAVGVIVGVSVCVGVKVDVGVGVPV